MCTPNRLRDGHFCDCFAAGERINGTFSAVRSDGRVRIEAINFRQKKNGAGRREFIINLNVSKPVTQMYAANVFNQKRDLMRYVWV